jgi:hypothetical protein
MKNLLSKLKPILKKEGVLYPNLDIKNTQKQIVLEDINKEAEFGDFLNNKGRIIGIRIHSLEVDFSYSNVVISKKIGDPGIHIIMSTNEILKEGEPIDYARNMYSALNKAYKYLLEAGLVACEDNYASLLDKTTMGLKKFKKMNKNKANLSAQNR